MSSLASGARIGVFEIVAKLGEGGMGEVYLARDTRLDREVALKVLPDLFTNDPDRLARFEREAKVLAALNHPNIAQVYGFEPPAAGSAHAAIAMELVDGQTLQEVIADAGRIVPATPGLPFDRALAIARQIATALEAAHDQGIIHRDLKPANVKVREDGTVKVLDFGLAKAFAADAESAQSGVANSPTLTARSTQLGMILGTAAYMSPEQAKGRHVDRRADVWAFGVVFFEMLAGRRVFDGDDVSDVLASVLKSEPDWSLLPADLPPPVRRLLRRCLEKDPKKRLRDVAEGMLQLDEGLASGSTSSIMMPADGTTGGGVRVRPVWRRAIPIIATAVLTALAILGWTTWMTPPPVAPLPIRFEHQVSGEALLLLSQDRRDLAISPDGTTIVYAVVTPQGARSLWLRRLDQLDATPLRGTEGGTMPFVSSDNNWVGFLDVVDSVTMKKVSVLGGPPATVVRATRPVQSAAWTSDGSIVYTLRGHPLQIVPDGGGDPTPLTTLDAEAGDVEHLVPSCVPGTSVILFVTGDGKTPALSGQLAAFDRASGRTVRLKIAGTQPRYVPSGHIVYAASDGSLRAVVFDAATMAVSGNPMPMLDGIGVKSTGAANFDVADDGRLVYTSGANLAAARVITWTDRTGKETPIATPPRNYFYVRISPDGARLSLDVRDQEEDIWIWDVRREAPERLTDKAGADQYGLWTPNGEHLVFNSTFGGRGELFRMRSDGTGQAEQITDTKAESLTPFPNAITPDGLQVIFRAASASTKNDLWIASMTGDRTVRKLLASEHDERNATLSPDGKWMAFESDLSGRSEIYVRPFPDVDSGRWPLSTAGGSEAVWSPAGHEVFFVSADNKLMTVPVDTSGRFTAGKPIALFDVSAYFFGGAGRNYDVSRDGKRFVMVKNPVTGGNRQSPPITIVLNWASELRARMK